MSAPRKRPPGGGDRPDGGKRPSRGRGRGGERSEGAAERPAPRGRAGGGAAKRTSRTGRPIADAASESLRLQAYLARAGVASRRASEELIQEGRVKVNGVTAEIGSKVAVGRDRVELDGRRVELQELEWIAVHKPKGFVSTRDDPEGRKTIYDLIPEELHHLFHVGRLDRASSGLILLTNEGEAANRLLHPRYGTTKEYLADVEGRPTKDQLRSLVDGIPLEDGQAHALEVEVTGQPGPGVYRIRLVMEEGRYREVRRMFEAIGHPVGRLFRRRFGPIEIGKLRPGEWRRLTRDELKMLRAPAKPTRPPRS